MNILYLCDEYPPGQHGGIGTSVQLLAREMAGLGHKIIVAGLYTPGFGGDDEFEDYGVKVYRFRWDFGDKWLLRQSLMARICSRMLKDAGIIEWDIKRSLVTYKKELERIIIDNQIDIIEMPDYNDYMRFCKSYVPFPELSAPVVVKIHGSITYTRGGDSKVPARIVKMEKGILSQAVAVSAVSKYVADKSAGYFSYANEIKVLYNGINTNTPERNVYRNPKQVIYTGKLVQTKGIYQLAKAWNIVNRSMPDAQLLILGNGPQQKVISYLTKEAIDTVTFVGYVAIEKLYDYLLASAISVFPSYSEAFALAPLEAMACGTAVINSNRTSGPELIDDKINGLLIDPDNVEGIAAAILFLFNDPAECSSLATKGREKVMEQFEIRKIAIQNGESYIAILNDIK